MIAYKIVSRDLFDPNFPDGVLLDTYAGINQGITSCTFEARINEAGNMQFAMSRAHPAINSIRMYETTIGINMRYINSNGDVLDEWWPFLGRVIAISRDMYGNKTFSCEGILNILNDSYMSYWDHKHNTIKSFINDGVNCHNRLIGSITPNYGRFIIFDPSKGHGVNNPFSFSGEYNRENRVKTFLKVLDGMREKIINAYGGVIYCTVRPNPIDQYDFYIDIVYYDGISIGFDYDTYGIGVGDYPVEYGESGRFMPGEYGGPVPCFGIGDNITNITQQPVKDGVWTGVMAIGEDGITKMGDHRDVGSDDVYWIDQNLSPGGTFMGYHDRIVKAVEFPEVKKGETSGSELLGLSEQYVSRFASMDYFTSLNYTINGIEPCEVFGGVTKIIKPGFPVIINYDYNEEIVNFPCISIKHDIFNIEGSEYECGPIIPQNIINEDITTMK